MAHIQFPEIPSHVSVTSILVTHFAGIAMYDYRFIQDVHHYLNKIEPTSHFKEYGELIEKRFQEEIPLMVDKQRQTFTWRKQMIYEHLRKDIAQGINQIVLYGDGLNPMVVALAKEFPYAKFFCTDMSANILRAKQEALAELNITNVYCLLQNDIELGGNIYHNNFEGSAPTIFTMEGYLAYIPPAERAPLIKNIFNAHIGMVKLYANHVETWHVEEGTEMKRQLNIFIETVKEWSQNPDLEVNCDMKDIVRETGLDCERLSEYTDNPLVCYITHPHLLQMDTPPNSIEQWSILRECF